MTAWLLILIIQSKDNVAVATNYVQSYKACIEAGDKFVATTRDSRFLCVNND